ncbi:MAG: response regulator transcription factor [Bacteroidota bacterium]
MGVKIVIADDQHVNRKAAVHFLQSRTDYEVCAQAANGSEALNAIKTFNPDILLLDLNMPVMDGFEVLETLQKERLPVKTIVVSMNDNPKQIARCWELGARGFLSTFNGTDEEQTAIDSVMQDGFYFNAQSNTALLSDIARLKKFEPRFDAFTVQFDEEQMRVLHAYSRQLSNIEIGEEICASDGKVERIKAGMVAKLKVKNFMSVFIFSLQKGILNLDEIPIQPRKNITEGN